MCHHARIVKADALRRRELVLGRDLLDGAVSRSQAQEILDDLEADDVAGPSAFLTARELCASAESDPDWIVEGYVARATITELTAKIKVGKTHLTMDLVAAVLAGRPFLDRPTTRVPVIYLTEERPSTAGAVLRRVGLSQADDLHLLLRRDAPRDWEAACLHALAYARQVAAGLIVCDTLSDWAGLAGEEENDSGAALEAMRPLQRLAEAGLAVIVLRHERKGGGQVGDSARGSTAFGGAADILLSLQRVAGQGHENRRELTGVGRLDDIPPKLVVDLEEQHYVSQGTESAVESGDARRIILEWLPCAPESALTENGLLEHFAEGESKRSTLKRVLRELIAEGRVQLAYGAGGCRKNAYGYWQTEVGS
jgi:RecA-family ATPase